MMAVRVAARPLTGASGARGKDVPEAVRLFRRYVRGRWWTV